MRISTTTSLLAFAAALAACTAEAPDPAEPATSTDPPAETSTTEPGTGGTGSGPAGEVPADTREPSDGATAEKPAPPAKLALPDGVDEKWALYYEHGIDFVFGSEAGVAKAAETGKPMMMFYTATW